jgi:hypothetical protein
MSPLVDVGSAPSPAVVTVTRAAKPGVVVVSFTAADPDRSDVYRVTRIDGGSGTHPADTVESSPLSLIGVAAGDKVVVEVSRYLHGVRQTPAVTRAEEK